MEFLEKFVIPQSSEHLQLLHYLVMLVMFLFVPFISMILGGTFLSLFYKHKGTKENNPHYLRFAREIIEIVTVNKGVGIILGAVPVLTATLVYAQLLHLGSTLSVLYLTVSFFVIILALIFIYTYRYSVKFSMIFTSLDEVKTKDQELARDISELKDSSKHMSMRTGYYGLALLLVSIWVFVAGISIATFPKDWSIGSNFFAILFSWVTISRFLFFIALALTFTGGTILFRYFYWEGGITEKDDGYKEFVRETGIHYALFAGLLLPLLLALTIFSLPDTAISGTIFGYATMALLLMFLSYHLLYSMLRNANVKYTGILYIVLILVVMAVVIKDQTAVDNATEMQTVVLSNKYDDMMAQLAGANKAPKINGEDIFNNICSSCHAFDHKVVGPPYKQTLPKYEGKEGQLVKFILNPTQNNPGYPPMPNPGLRPDQAKAVAKWLLSVYKTK
ncbi:MAG: c-type cytochrome [Ignavibacteriaceae bacterium]